MTDKTRKVVTVIVGMITGIFSLPALIFGGYFFVCWFRIHTTDAFYVEYPYLLAGCLILATGLLSAFCTVWGLRRRSFHGLVFVFPLLGGLAMLVYIPDGTPHVQRSMVDDGNYLSDVGSFFRVWYESHHNFPGNEAEFLDAMSKGPARWHGRIQAPSYRSDYGQRGHNLPYEIVIVENASGPRLNDTATHPGVIYYCLSSDRQQYWVTMTALDEDLANIAVLKTTADPSATQPWIISASAKEYR
jgi:hypothetical protein